MSGFALGWVLSDDGSQVLLSERDLENLQSVGAQLVRVDFRLGRYRQWDQTILDRYEQVVESLDDAGVAVLGLVSHEAVADPHQAQWNAGNAEVDGGDGHNAFIDAYVGALQALVGRFHDRVRLWELWNEPNVWTRQEQRGDTIVYSGGSYIYPSNYAVLLAQGYTALKSDQAFGDVVVISGGVLGHNIGGVMSAANAGALYLRAVYENGIHGFGDWNAISQRFGSYPLDAVGQHLYLDQGSICPDNHISAYLAWLHEVATRYEGGQRVKPTYVTEAAWTTASVSPEVQAANLTTLFTACADDPDVASALWYELRDNPAARTYYGVLDSRWAAKPSFDAFHRSATGS